VQHGFTRIDAFFAKTCVTFPKDDTWLTYLLCGTIVIIVSASNLILDKVSGCGVCRWPEMCTKVNCIAWCLARCRLFEVSCQYISDYRTIDLSLTCRQHDRAGMLGVSHQFTVVHVFWWLTLAGQSAVWIHSVYESVYFGKVIYLREGNYWLTLL